MASQKSKACPEHSRRIKSQKFSLKIKNGVFKKSQLICKRQELTLHTLIIISDFRSRISESISDIRCEISDVIARRAESPTWQTPTILKGDCFPFDPSTSLRAGKLRAGKLRAGKLRVATMSEIANLKLPLNRLTVWKEVN